MMPRKLDITHNSLLFVVLVDCAEASCYPNWYQQNFIVRTDSLPLTSAKKLKI